MKNKTINIVDVKKIIISKMKKIRNLLIMEIIMIMKKKVTVIPRQ